MSIELGFRNNKGKRQSSNLMKTPAEINIKSKRSDAYTPNISERRVSKSIMENSSKVTPILSNLLKANPTKKKAQAPSRYLDYLHEKKTSSTTLLANRDMISRKSGRISKANLISRAILLNEPFSNIKEAPKKTTPTRSISKDKIDSSLFIREKYRIKSSQKESMYVFFLISNIVKYKVHHQMSL